MKQGTLSLPLAVIVGLTLVLLMVGLLTALPGQAAPPAAPTPIGSVVASDAGNYYVVVDHKGLSTADGYYDAPVSLASFEWADWQYVIDQSTPVNTTTLTLQYSNDGKNWVTGPALVSANVADAGDLVRLPLFGRYTRVYVNVTDSNTGTVTVDVNLLAK